ncbi:MAG: LacI family DNA-binding transcriptional regulator [Chitinophagaceae bacterium]
MPEEREITIYDIARALKISSATVSRGLRQNSLVKEKTRKKIVDKANELGYRYNAFASNLRRNKTHTIGVLMHELNSSFMLSVLTGIEKVIGESGYDIIIAHSAESRAKEIANVKNLFHKRVDGLIASLAFDTPGVSHFDLFTNKKIPVIFFDRVEEKKTGTKIIIDNFKAGYIVTEHLIQQGCSRIAHLTANLARNVYDQRFKGYLAALRDYKIKYDEKLLIVNDLTPEASSSAARELMQLKKRPDGLFATGDLAAVMCIQTFLKAGLKVPRDIAVAGFNNDIVSTIIEPNLTTINYSGSSMGETAARMMLGHLNGKLDISTTDTIVMNSELIIRESSQKNNFL